VESEAGSDYGDDNDVDEYDNDADNDRNDDARLCTNRKRFASSHCKRQKTGRGSMQASDAQKITPGRNSSSSN